MLGQYPVASAPLSYSEVSLVVSIHQTTLRFASRTFATYPTDSPAGIPIDGRVKPILVDRSIEITSLGTFGPTVASAVGEIELNNADGGLDGLLESKIVEGRPIRIKVAAVATDASGTPIIPRLQDFGVVFSGVVKSWSASRDTIRIAVSDPRERLTGTLQGTPYRGTGGEEGPAELAGVPRPLSLGTCYNVTPQAVDPVLLTYQVHDGPIDHIRGVFDRAAPLTFKQDYPSYDDLASLTVEDATDPTQAFVLGLGEWASSAADGVFRLGGPPAGKLTADVFGDLVNDTTTSDETWDDDTLWSDDTGWYASRGTLVQARTVGLLALRLLQRAGLTDAEYDEGSFRDFDTIYPYEIAHYLAAGESTTYEDVLTAILTPVNACLVATRYGVFRLTKLGAPSAGASLTITEDMIENGQLEVLERPYVRPYAAWRVSYNRNWTLLSPTDIAGVVIDTDNLSTAFVQRSVSVQEVGDRETAVLYPTSGAAVIESNLGYGTDASACASDFAKLYTRHRRFFRATAYGILFQTDLGRTVSVFHPRFGLAMGRNFLVVGCREDARSGQTELLLFG